MGVEIFIIVELSCFRVLKLIFLDEGMEWFDIFRLMLRLGETSILEMLP
jgi:hypothetical protein